MPSPLMTAITPAADELRAQARKVISRCRMISTFSEQPGRISRTFLSPPMRDCHREIASWLTPLGVDVTLDGAGNLHAVYSACDAGAPRLLIGSHLDTVPDAGAFDGLLGVVIGVSLLEMLNGARLPFAIELVGFSEEEGVRFKTPFLGSRALAGKLDETLLAIKDEQGISVREAIKNFGLNPDDVPKARLQDDTLAYIEFHIEQGPVLEDVGLPLGIVEAIAGQSRTQLTFTGRANHAGTTPMHLRRDAAVGAAEWILNVEREAKSVAGLVATVGSVKSNPGSSNVIAGEAEVMLDVRHREDQVRGAAVDALLRSAEEIAARRGLLLRRGAILNQPATEMNTALTAYVEEAVQRAGSKPYRMVSGAGHDAMILAETIPAAMMFLRTPSGISHSPEENVNTEDVEKALLAGMNLLGLLASSGMPRTKRTQRA